MATAAEVSVGSVFVARSDELRRVRSALDAARARRFTALLVTGDAGIGKTRLVERACAQAGPDLLVVPGGCLPLGTTSVPLLPLRQALRRLPAQLGAPRLTASGDQSGAGAEVLDDWLDKTCREVGPVALVVDDLHWADEGTLDALMYVLAAPPDRRLAVLMTLRRGEVGGAHTLQRWLADVRRMPVLTELRLAPFGRAETRDQLAALFGSSPHESLVSEVHDRSEGNPYLNRLLVEEVDGDSRHLGPDLPADLRSAVLRPWHRLSTESRALVLALAIGGEFGSGPAVRRAAEIAGIPPERTPPALREALDEGVVDLAPNGDGYWFHHSLQAEALEAGLAGADRRLLHAGFAGACERDLAAADPTPSSARLTAVAAVAHHHEQAGNDIAAYRWTLEGVELAERLDDQPAVLSLLRRLLDLRERLAAGQPEAPEGLDESRTDLLDRLRRVAEGLGDHQTELTAVEALLEALDESTEPLWVCALLVRREHLRFSTGRGFLRVEPVRHAVEISRHRPRSWEHAYALAELAQASLWADDPDAQRHVATALERAEATGHPRALAYACAAASMGTTFAQLPGGAELGARGVDAAVVARDWWAYVHATLWEANGSGTWGGPEWAAVVQGRREQLEALHPPHPYLAWLSADEAGSLLGAGDWRRCSERLRVALGSDPGVAVDVTARLSAARLAVLQGRLAEAEGHLTRADELFAETSGFLAFPFDAVRAMVRLGAGDPEGAYAAAMTGATSPGVPPTLCEWLCPLAARALADLAQAAREEGRPDAHHLERLDALVERFPHVIQDSAFLSLSYRARLDALDALYAAEVARARRAGDGAERWHRAATLLDGVWPWDAAYATYRAAEAALLDRSRPRAEGAALVRRAHALAADLRAEPVLREVVALAESARFSLAEVRPATSESVEMGAAGGDRRLQGLTAREREVLAHVVAGRTYGEIARALFLSEKTVSSHISNLLRKTGAANRVELATMARRAAERGQRPAATASGMREPPRR